MTSLAIDSAAIAWGCTRSCKMMKWRSYSLRMEREAIKESVVRGHHIYKEVWRAVIGQELPVLSEPNNHHDRAVAIYMDGEVESKWVNGNSHSMSASRMANGDGEWLNQCHRFDETRCRGARRGWRMAMANASSAMSDVFTVLFTFLVHFWLVIYKVILIHTTFTCLLQLLSTCGIFRLAHSTFSRAVRFLLSRRQHAPNKRCALNNDVRLITQFYSIYIVILDAVRSPHFLNEKLRSDMNNRKRKKKWQWGRNGMKRQLLKGILTMAERKQQLINR